MDDLLTEMFTVADDAGHWAIMNEIAGFMYENALDSGFYSVNVLGPWVPRSTLGGTTCNKETLGIL